MSSNGNIFCIIGPLWGEFTSRRWIPLTKTSCFDVLFDLSANKGLCKQSRRHWFETPLHSLQHHCYDVLFSICIYMHIYAPKCDIFLAMIYCLQCFRIVRILHSHYCIQSLSGEFGVIGSGVTLACQAHVGPQAVWESLNKMAHVLQMTFSNAISCINCILFWF